MTLRPLGETGTSEQGSDDKSDDTHRALSLLDTAEQVARKTRVEADEAAQRLIAQAREEADRIRAEARGDAPELHRATEQLRMERQRALDDIEVLRARLGSLMEAHQRQAQETDR
jgi:cell division septum initiation protein DivIVA